MSTQINTADADFDNIKASLKTFLQGQDTLKDYQFEGSVLSVLLDVLSANSHYNVLYDNLTANEMFLDSASKYSSAVSLAKTIGYIPRSYRCSVAKINLTVTLPDTETPVSHTLPKGTTFISPIGDIDYMFSTLTDYTAVRYNGKYVFNNISLYEGTQAERIYTVSDASQFVIPHLNADTTTLSVNVRDSGVSNVITTWKFAPDLLKVSGSDYVYFIKQREDLFYQVTFGNDVIGKNVSTNNVVILNYMVPTGSEANGCDVFTYFGGHRAELQYSVNVLQPAVNGAEQETLQSIKFNAPKAYTAQNRAVTVSDYETLIYNSFPNIQSVKIWGGQDHIPKTYGKVFVCAKPTGREYLTVDEIDSIKAKLNDQRVMTMIPEFVSPEFIRLEITSNVYYNPNVARKTNGEMTTKVRTLINEFGSTVGAFDNSFRMSALSARIDASDPAIISNITTVRCIHPLLPAYQSLANYTVNFGNPIFKKADGGTIYTSRFYEVNQDTPCYLVDDGSDNLVLMLDAVGNTAAVALRTVGTVDYLAGKLAVTGLNIVGIADPEFLIIFTPSSNDVIPIRQYILELYSDYTKVNLIADSVAAGNSQSGTNHIFSPSR